MMKNIIIISILCAFLISCTKNGYIIGGKKNPTNKVNKTTYDFLASFPVTTETAQLIKRAGLIDEVNGNVTIIAPSNYAVDRFLRRKNNRRLRLNPDTTLLTINTIPVDTLQQLKMYIVDGKWWSKTIPKGGIILPTHEKGDTILLYVAPSNSEPGAAWDGSGIPGLGYQYSNFMQTEPEKVYFHFKRGQSWEMDPQQRENLGYDNPECDQVYEMYISDVITTTGVVHVIYSGDYNFSDHYYYHTLFFFGTRADDLL
jgi:hypothetical protein